MSTTAVPLRPVSKGGLAILWVGLAMLVIGAAAWAWSLSRVPSITLQTVTAGTGPSPTDGDVALVKYEGKLADGTVFDQAEQAALPVASVVPGFSQGLKRMQRGGSYVLHIPAALGYGATASGPIPANSDLTFNVTLIEFKSEAEVRAMMQQQQAMQQMMQQQGAGGPPPGR